MPIRPQRPLLQTSTLRIIAGRWRGSNISFPVVEGIRPTPSRVRESLFNWLMHDIKGAVCLDLFAGSGALGFEALSRGAKQVVMVEKNIEAVASLKANARRLCAYNDNAKTGAKGDEPLVIHPVAFSKEMNTYLGSASFDIVFVDPPFEENILLDKACCWLESSGCLAENALIYIESACSRQPISTPSTWQCIRNKTAGRVSYSLYRRFHPLA